MTVTILCFYACHTFPMTVTIYVSMLVTLWVACPLYACYHSMTVTILCLLPFYDCYHSMFLCFKNVSFPAETIWNPKCTISGRNYTGFKMYHSRFYACHTFPMTVTIYVSMLVTLWVACPLYACYHSMTVTILCLLPFYDCYHSMFLCFQNVPFPAETIWNPKCLSLIHI